MKNVKVFLGCSTILLLMNFGCSKTELIEESPSNIEPNVNLIFPERPLLNIGESNWEPAKNTSLNVTLSDVLVTTNLNNQTLAQLLDKLLVVGPDAPVISNITFTGSNIAAGSFTGGTNIIGFDSGIVLSTGNIASIVGPNTSSSTSTNLGTPGDADLAALIPGFSVFDATVLEFDFTCENIQTISFQYVFSSEEYNEYVNSSYNDVFGFFLNGENIALIPGTTTPVSINNINCGNPYNPLGGTNCDLFINNTTGALNTEMDGLTVVLTATANVNPGTNRIKLAIADAGDRILDSNVFIKANSFVCAPPAPTEIEVHFDSHPTSCPNPLNRKANGLIPTAILGTATFDVNTIDVSTLKIEGVSPVDYGYQDVTAPVENRQNQCDCTTAGPDGYTDLTLKFSNQALVAAFGPLPVGTQKVVTITGNLLDGTPLTGVDCMIVVR